MAVELATAYINLVPSMKGARGVIAREVGGEADAAGRSGGRRMGGLMAAGITSLVGPAIALAGGVKIASFLSSAVEQASGLGESMNALNVVFGESAAGIAALGQSAAQNLGLSNLDFNNLAVRFSNFAKTVAGDGGDVVGTMSDLTGRAADFASVMNLEVSEAARLFQSGLAGESEPLRAFGIDLSAASVAAYAYANGIAAQGAELTEAEKVQARYGLLMQSTSQVQGDFANTSEGLANQQRILSAGWANLSASVGSLLLPAVTGVVTAMNTYLIPALQGGVDWVTNFIGLFQGGAQDGDWERALGLDPAFVDKVADVFFGIVSAVRGVLPGIMEGLAPIGDAFMALLPTLTSLIPTVLSVVQAFSPMHLILEAILPILPQLAETVGGLVATLITAVTPLLPVIGQIAEMLSGFLGQALATLAPILAQVATLLGGALGEAFTALAPVVSTIAQVLGQVLGAVLSALTPLLGVLGDLIVQLMPPILSLIDPIVQIVQAFLPLLGVVGDLIGTLLPPLIGIIMALLPPIAELVVQLVDALAPILELVAELIADPLVPIISTLIGWVAEVIAWVLELAGPALGWLVGILADVIGWVASVIESFVGWLDSMGGISQVVHDVWQGILDFFAGVIQWIVDAFMNWTLPGLLIQHWDSIRNAVVTAWNNIVSWVTGIPQRIVDALAAVGRLWITFQGWIGSVKDAIVRKFEDAIGWVGGVPGKILGALGDVGQILYGAGEDIISGLWDGLKSMWENVTGWFSGLGDWIADNKGPKAYDLALLVPAGRWIMTGLREGLEGEIPALRDSLGRVSSAISVDGAMSARTLIAGGGRVAGGGITVNVTADPRYAEVQARRAAERFRDAVSMYGVSGVAAGVA